MNVGASILEGLNQDQQQAIEYVGGPLLIVAGPGSGKTRVITHRIAYLVRVVGLSPRRICAVTFTNRAAREMRGRLERLLGQRAQQLTAGTFHAFCAVLLRRDGEAIGIPKDFVIFDDDDQMDTVKRAMKSVNIDPKRFPPRSILSAISSAKSQLLSPDRYLLHRSGYYDEQVQQAYAAYQRLLVRNHALDFDDLLSRTVELFQQAPDVLGRYQERFIHLMMDEFQDTNLAQYQIAKNVAGKYLNLCVVGDPDQSIYAWRNADLRNILSFHQDYPQARVVHLSQNYRSTKTILEAAAKVIAANRQRLEQELWTDNPQGGPVSVGEAYNEEEEAMQVLQEVDRLSRHHGYNLHDMVVTYRVNAQSRVLEEACLRYGVPYKLVGGVRFYHRKEVKDLLAYLRLLQDPYDEVSLDRTINTPPRGVGPRTLDDLRRWAANLGVPPYAALQLLAGEQESASSPMLDAPLRGRQAQALAGFLGLMTELRQSMAVMELPQLFDEVMERTGYRRYLRESESPDAEDRLENLAELRGVASGLAGQPASETLVQFLERAALVSDQDSLTDDEKQYLTLITLHQIKGLEYPVVFITGLEENLLPHGRSLDDPGQLEEERRLLYVGMTRAKERLYLLRAFRRHLSGGSRSNLPSRFLAELPGHLTEMLGRRTRMAPTASVAYDRWHSPGEAADGPVKTSPVPFTAGDKVVHATFGQGMVISCQPKSGDYEVTVVFIGGSGAKRLLHSLANLQKAEREPS